MGRPTATVTGEPPPLVEVRDLRKRFGSVVALDDARLTMRAGEVHALVGENGAGKTTLLSILAGHLRPDGGHIRLGGAPLELHSPRQGWERGIGMVHQHFALVPRLTGEENLALGVRRARKGWALPTDWLRSRVAEIRAETGLEVELQAPVEELSIGERQRLEIVKVLLRDPRVLVLDEPTAVLAPAEVEGLLSLLRRLASEGRAVLLVAHKLDEVLSVADHITVLRRGRTVLEAPRAQVDARGVAEAMVGDADALELSVIEPREAGEVVVRWRADDSAELVVRSGEIVGIAGVEGNGQRALARALAGGAGAADPQDADRSVGSPGPKSPDLPHRLPHRLQHRVAYIPQDRSLEGLVGSFSLVENVALGASDRSLLMDWAEVTRRTRELIERYDIRAAGPSAPAASLSGGNQQRLVVARELSGSPRLVVAENPSRGLDVAAARFVRDELRALRRGADAPGIVLISTDLDEILALSDRIWTLVRGRLTPVPPDEHTREGVGRRMLTGEEGVGEGMADRARGVSPGDRRSGRAEGARPGDGRADRDPTDPPAGTATP